MKNKRIPQKGDRVGTLGHNGAFVVSDINSEQWTADLTLLGRADFGLKGIPWDVLYFLDEEDASQSAARLVKEDAENE